VVPHRYTWNNPEVICHKLSIKADAKTVKQKPRRMNEARNRTINDEVDRLLLAVFIRETFNPNWLSNPILVKKKNGKWRGCIDFTNLNEACPKDSYPLLRIDQLVEATAGHEFLSFIDAYFGYNQIKIHPSDEDQTTFTTGREIYRYKMMMSFGLKMLGPRSSEWSTKSSRT